MDGMFWSVLIGLFIIFNGFAIVLRKRIPFWILGIILCVASPIMVLPLASLVSASEAGKEAAIIMLVLVANGLIYIVVGIVHAIQHANRKKRMAK